MANTFSLNKTIHIEAQSGTAFRLEQGETVRVIDVEGEQVADLFCFAASDTDEKLSSGQTTDYSGKLYLSAGDALYSNRSRAMLTITGDTVGRHIMLYAPCSQPMFEKTYSASEPHPNCQDNLAASLAPYRIDASQITIPLNIFMNVQIAPDGSLAIKPPVSKSGSYLELRAEMDLIVGLSACSAGLCNNFKCTAIRAEIYSP
ncbi:MAG: urea carboxylase-associated family protein [Anaerolineales bacterium]|nr:urea carboxylase-associated family protein [Anaerolineales bacterium]